MYAHLDAHIGGWWDGVLHPMQAADHLLTLLLVGLIGGISVRVGRSSWALPAAFVASMAAVGTVGSMVHRVYDLDAVVVALVALLVAVLVVPARVTRTVAPVVVIACGALHGLAHCTDASGRARPPSYIAGFTFTCCLLLSVGSIVGAATGRSLQARSQRRRAVAKPATDERALV